jgi:aspartate racemase
MLTIGMLGGMSPESTAAYYRLLNEGVRARRGGLHSARVVLHSVDFGELHSYQVSGRWSDAAAMLVTAARGLGAAGADVLLICANTMHKVADEVQAAVGVPLLHICDIAASAVLAAGVSRVGLLGTAYTMEQDFYRDRLASHGLEVVVPDAPGRAEVHRIIYEELSRGMLREESRAACRAVISDLVADGVTGVILGCTELELLLGAADSPVPVFPTTRLHVDAALEFAFAEAV